MFRALLAFLFVALQACLSPLEAQQVTTWTTIVPPDSTGYGHTTYASRTVIDSVRTLDSVRVNPTAPVLAGKGVPFGPHNAPSPLPSPFTAENRGASSTNIVATIAAARAAHQTILLAIPGGSHKVSNPGCCLTNGVFDMAKYRATMAKFNTPAIKAAIAAGQADGTLVGSNVMDEPQVSGGGDGNTWGPPGTMTKARVDTLCAIHHALGFIALVGQDNPTALDPSKNYAVCDGVIFQYSYRMGPIIAWRDGALAWGVRSHVGVLFSFNPVDGGTPQNTPMTAAQITEVARALGAKTCGLLKFWRYDATLNTRFKQAYLEAAAALKILPAPPNCRRLPVTL